MQEEWFVEGWVGQELGPPKLVRPGTSDPRPLTAFSPFLLPDLGEKIYLFNN